MKQRSVLAEVQNFVDNWLPVDHAIDILEAGGGSFTHFNLPDKSFIAALDISPEQLERNNYADRKILGDIEDVNAFQERYDLIICFDVLEHIRHPRRAFKNMANALQVGGLLVIGCPNLVSLKGFTTKFTPHKFHVWYYRKIRGISSAGRLDNGPFQTFLRREMTPESLKQHACILGLKIIYDRSYVGPAVYELKVKHPVLYIIYYFFCKVFWWLTFCKLDLRNSDFVIVLQRVDELRKGAA